MAPPPRQNHRSGSASPSNSPRHNEQRRVVMLADLTAVSPANLPSKEEMIRQFQAMFGPRIGPVRTLDDDAEVKAAIKGFFEENQGNSPSC